MSLRLILMAPLLLCASLFAQGVNVNITGTITDTSGAPVSGATVTLERLAITVTSGVDGSFSLVTPTAIHRVASTGVQASRLRSGVLSVILAEAGPVAVSAHGLDGRTLVSTIHRLDAGAHSIKLPEGGAGVRFYRVKAGGREEVFRVVGLEGFTGGSVALSVAGKEGSSLAKSAAGVPLYDAVSAARTGYLKSYVSITTSDTSGIQIKLLPAAFPRFSFFVTSLAAMQYFSGSPNGFGGDLRFGETGAGAGLRGADKLCAAIAERSLRNSSYKGWRAFLSVSQDAYGQQANAIDRIGPGPWYDRIGRVLAMTKTDLLSATGRPANGDIAIRGDFPNEDGVLNQFPNPSQPTVSVDNHHFLTGSTTTGTLYMPSSITSRTCSDWTTSAPVIGIRPRTGWSWAVPPTRVNWISGTDEGGCGAGVYLIQSGGAQANNPIVGSGGGYGGIYCFALTQ